MANGGVMGNGVEIAFSAASPVSWTGIGQLADSDVPGLMRDKLASSTHGSPFKRAMPGMKEVPDLNLLVIADLNPATMASHDALRTHLEAGTTLWWRIEVPEDRALGSCVAFELQGWVQKWQPKAPLESRQEIEVTIVFDGTTLTKYADGASAIS
jgi:hypothetical protein